MDGNRRWAKDKNLPEFEGHRIGEECIEPIVNAAIEMGIQYLTFWAFSTENWYRSKKEVAFLLNLYRFQLNKKVDKFHKKNVRINVLGNLSMFPKDIQDKTKNWMEKTKTNTKITVNFALSYGGRDEIIRAINKWSKQTTIRNQSRRSGIHDAVDTHSSQTASGQLTIKQFNNYLDTVGQPDPDLLIRTGGEKRLSGFLLWQMEYTELYFTDIYWPDFNPSEFKKAILDFQARQRRFGK